MKKLLSIIVLTLLWSNLSFADTRYNLVQIGCYEESGYFELRKFQSWNLNMYKVLEEKNLISLYGDKNDSKKITKKCVFPKKKFVENEIVIIVELNTYCRTPYTGEAYSGSENRCNEVDAKFKIWHQDINGKKLIIDNGQFWLGGEPNTLRISRIEYVAQDLYFSIHFEEKIDSSTYLKKETDLFMNDYKYPLSNETLRKMF